MLNNKKYRRRSNSLDVDAHNKNEISEELKDKTDDILSKSILIKKKEMITYKHIKNIEIITDIEPFDFNADFAWSVEAFQNIIKNCIEHTPNGGRITISARSTNLYSEFIIEDNGAGISPDDLPHIFERFYHGKDSDEESVGIGLALAKTVLEKQKATLSAASILGKGTAFTIKFYKTTV